MIIMNPNKQNDVSWRLIEFLIGRVNPINMKNIITLKSIEIDEKLHARNFNIDILFFNSIFKVI
tara:strand:+ start:844 stop:1035 length:192 start_codon:yes stop_codon:yes gene_type:complete